jgi:heat shock protein HslJ
MKQSYLVFFLLVIAGLSCKNESVVSPIFDQVKNIQWRLVEFRYTDTVIIGLQLTDSIFLSFDGNRKASGFSRGLCGNSYFSVYHNSNGNVLWIDSLVSSEAHCPNSRYWQFIDQFLKVRYYQLELSRLVLSDSTRNHLIFQRMP